MGEITFVGTGETRGYPYLVCKKSKILSPTRMSWGSCIPWPVPLSNNAKDNKFYTKPLSLLVDGSMCRWMDKRKGTVKTIYP